MPGKKLNDKEIQALVSLLDDEDSDVVNHVKEKIRSLGHQVIPYLEDQWENSFSPEQQRRIEDLIHNLQFEGLLTSLRHWKDHESEDLLKGMWLVATYQYPDLEYEYLKKEIEQLYYEAWVSFKKDIHPFDQVRALNNVLFNKLKFTSNTKNFHSPGNSMINVVMETKRGNPITLCVIYMLVGVKLGMPLSGVNLPNLFILTYKDQGIQFYINAFNKGLIFTKTDIDNYIQQLQINPMDIFYEPCSHIDIIKRVLRNLSISFEKMGEHIKADEAKQLLQIFGDDFE